jgi:hypothetical protein
VGMCAACIAPVHACDRCAAAGTLARSLSCRQRRCCRCGAWRTALPWSA